VILLIFLILVINSVNAVTVKEVFEINQKDGVVPATQVSRETSYFYAGSKLIASKDSDGLEYKYQDRLGSDIESRQLPFGQELVNSGNRFEFTGKELDNSNLYYFGARYYDSNLGRFTIVDSNEKEPAYQYVRNNPMNLVDPDGNDPIPLVALRNVIEFSNNLIQSPYRFTDMDLPKVYQYDYSRREYRDSICSLASSYAALDSLSDYDGEFDDFVSSGIKRGVVGRQQGLLSMERLFSHIEKNFPDVNAEYFEMSREDIRNGNYFWQLESMLMEGKGIVINVANLDFREIDSYRTRRGLHYLNGHYMNLIGTYIFGDNQRTFKIMDPATQESYFLDEDVLLGSWAQKGYRGFTISNLNPDVSQGRVTQTQDEGHFFDNIFNFMF